MLCLGQLMHPVNMSEACCLTLGHLKKATRQVVLCVGRVMHHLKEVEGMSLRTVEFCVFDEADRVFEMGFAVQLREILSRMIEARQVSPFQCMYCMHVKLHKCTNRSATQLTYGISLPGVEHIIAVRATSCTTPLQGHYWQASFAALS